MEQGHNPLLDIFINNKDQYIHKWIHYFDVYHRHFAAWRGKEFRFLEIGIQNGGSMRMWKKYFGSQAQYIGMDIDENCRELSKESVDVWIGDQASVEFWQTFKLKYPSLDVVLDDGGHTMEQQIVTFLQLFPILTEGGIYVCEDNHTSYLNSHGGGLKREGTFIEFVKNLVDEMHAWYFRSDEKLKDSALTRSLYSIHVYDSIVVFEKKKIIEPVSFATGSIGHIQPLKFSDYTGERQIVD